MTSESDAKSRKSWLARWCFCCCCFVGRTGKLVWAALLLALVALALVAQQRVRDPGGPYGFDSRTTGEDVLSTLAPHWIRHMTFVVTGATSGIGYETAKLLAKHDTHVILVGRTKEKAEAARLRMLRELTGGFRDEDHVQEELQAAKRVYDEQCGPDVDERTQLARHCSRWKKRIEMLISDPEGRHYLPSLTVDSHAPSIRAYGCDFSNLTDVRFFVDRWVDAYRSVHKFRVNGLILNAGVLLSERKETMDGIEMHMGVNHVGHALLVHLMMKKLLVDGPYGRIVFVSSASHAVADASFLEHPTLARPPLPVTEQSFGTNMQLYANSKLAQIMFAKELHLRYHRHNITVASLDPGGILTNIQKDIAPWALNDSWILAIGRWLARKTVLKTVEQGAATQIYCTVAPDLHEQSGEYFANSHQTLSDREDLVHNATARNLLWDRTTALFAPFSHDNGRWYDPDDDPEPLPSYWDRPSGYLKAVIEEETGKPYIEASFLDRAKGK